MDIASGSGATALQKLGSPTLDAASKDRLRAYVGQARQYYEAVAQSDPIAKPLLGYYFVLNATKAYLTALLPGSTAGSLHHGLGQSNPAPGVPRTIYTEKLSIRANGTFQELAKHTGRGFVWSPGDMQLSKLLPYLSESVDLFATSSGTAPALLPVESVSVKISGKRPDKLAWLVAEVPALALKEAGLSHTKLLGEAAAFANVFKLVDDGNSEVATYESRHPISFTAMPRPLPGLRQMFDRALFVRNRSLAGGKDYLTLSPHIDLISGEALTFAVMLHLSNMVRYRPEDVDKLRGGGHWWLFTSWVDRACENFLLAISSRLALEEHVIS
jgi:hypothetical protein